MSDLTLIRIFCDNKGISLNELAKRVGITPNGLQRIINENSTKVDTLEKIASELGVSILSFFPKQEEELAGKLKDLKSTLDQVEFERTGFRMLYERNASTLAFYRHFLRVVQNFFQVLAKENPGLPVSLQKLQSDVEIEIDYLQSTDKYLQGKDISDQDISNWIRHGIMKMQNEE